MACLLGHIGANLSQAQVGKLYPVDEAYEDSTFIAFRLHLLEAIAARDTSFLFAHVDKGIRTSFGAGGGLADFKERWRPSSPKPDLWRTLGRIVGGGGIYRDGMFQAPYYYAAFPGEEHDPFQHGVVIGQNVNVRSRPDITSPVLTRLSYDIVRVESYPTQSDRAIASADDWVHVRLADGREGYVSSRYIGNPVGYRAIFNYHDGKWRMTALVAGD